MQCKPPLCDSKKCPPNVESIPATDTLDGFCSCVFGTVTYLDCPNDEKFSEEKGRCIEPCDKARCTSVNSIIPSSVNSYSFCTCTSTKPKFEICPKNTIFENGKCIADSRVSIKFHTIINILNQGSHKLLLGDPLLRLK